jgi:hypothetical protein
VADDTPGGGSAADFYLDRVGGDGSPLLVVHREPPTAGDRIGDLATAAVGDPLADGGASDPREERAHELDEAPGHGQALPTPDVNAGAKRTALWLGSGVVLVAVLIVAAFMVFGGGPAKTPPPKHLPTPAVVAAPTTTNLPVPQQDQAVSYTPSTDSCPAGSTSPLALADTSTDSAWVCSRGPQESFLDGQVLHVKFTCDTSRPESTCSYMLNSVSVTPGWVTKTPGGKDEWLQHRVVTRVQFNFFNGDQLAADPFFLDTHGIHGPVSATLPSKVMASRVDVLILHTDRPPVAPTPTTANPTPDGDGVQPPPSGLLDSVLGTGDPAEPGVTNPAGGTASDPVDATFAMSQLQFFGHSPN